MSTQTKTGPKLTAYECQQVELIAFWKSTPPNPFAELVKKITLPLADLVEKVIPDKLVMTAIEKAYAVAELVAGQEDIKAKAGVHELTELRKKPLEECDGLAQRVGIAAQTWATIQGAATGAGGFITTLIDVPLLFVLSLRTIRRIGHCYGYTLDHPHDRTFVLGILIAGTSGSLAIKRRRLDQLREIKELLVEETEEDILADEALSFLFQLEVFEEVPGIGMISALLLNLAFIRRIEVTAQRVFQERWLEDNGKVHVIKPAPVHDRRLAGGWRETLGLRGIRKLLLAGIRGGMPVYAAGSVMRSFAR